MSSGSSSRSSRKRDAHSTSYRCVRVHTEEGGEEGGGRSGWYSAVSDAAAADKRNIAIGDAEMLCSAVEETERGKKKILKERLMI